MKISVAIFREEILLLFLLIPLLLLLLPLLLPPLTLVVHSHVNLLLLLHLSWCLFLAILAPLLPHLLFAILGAGFLPRPRPHLLLGLPGHLHYYWHWHFFRRVVNLGLISEVPQTRAHFFRLLPSVVS
jgi:hypothetical protein